MKARPFLVAGSIVALAAVATGCVMPDQVSQMQKDMADVRQELRELRKGQDETMQAIARVEADASGRDDQIDRAEIADLNLRMDQVARSSGTTDERINDLADRLDRMASELDQTRQLARQSSSMAPPMSVDPGGGNAAAGAALGAGAGAAAAGAAVDAVPDAEELYNTAYADFSKGNYALAVSGFQEYQQRFPESALADNALYWVGECHFSQGNFPDAVDAFDGLLEAYPQSDKAAAGNLKKAMAYLEQNQIGQAIVQFRYVDSSFPGSDEAKIARDKLTSLGASI